MAGEKPLCRLCGSEKLLTIDRDGDFLIVLCRDCTFITTYPVPGDEFIAGHYEDGYFEQSPDELSFWAQARRPVFDQALILLAKRLGAAEGKKLLDVGSAYGAFMERAKEAGFESFGVELSETPAEYAAKERGLRVCHGTIAETRASGHFEDGSFDAVAFLDVLEHIADFRGALSDAYALLGEGGAVIVRVPNADFHVFKNRAFAELRVRWKWGVYEAPSHLNHFRPAALRTALRDAGFRDVSLSNGAQSAHGGVSRRAPLLALDAASAIIRVLSRGFLLMGNSLVATAVKK